MVVAVGSLTYLVSLVSSAASTRLLEQKPQRRIHTTSWASRKTLRRQRSRRFIIRRVGRASGSSSLLTSLWQQLAKKWHPDTNQDKGSNERFMEIQEAYDVSRFLKRRKALA